MSWKTFNQVFAGFVVCCVVGLGMHGSADAQVRSRGPNAGAVNLSGTNTGDVTLGAVGSSANANGASLSGQVLTLQPASASFPGVVTTGTQTIAGAKTVTGTFNTRDIRPLAGTDDANDIGTPTLRYRFLWMSKYIQISGYANASLPTCDSTLKGVLTYDTTNDKHVGCNGSAWTNFY